MNPRVDAFLRSAEKWRGEYRTLRRFIMACGLDEELKWGVPCFTSEGKNIVLIHGFKEFCAILFFKGALLDDPDGVLIRQTENVQAARHMRFTSVRQIEEMEGIIKSYVRRAVEVERSGKKVKIRETSEYPVASEFQERLNGDAALRKAFQKLTPGRQRSYLFYFSQAKQSKTRVLRIERCVERILDGRGLND